MVPPLSTDFGFAPLPCLYLHSLLLALAKRSAFETAIAVDRLTRTSRAYLTVLARYLSFEMVEVGVVIGAAAVEAVGVAVEGAEVGLVRVAGIVEVVMEVVMPMRLLLHDLAG